MNDTKEKILETNASRIYLDDCLPDGNEQNMIQPSMPRHDAWARENAYAEFVKSLKQTDMEFVKRLFEEFEDE